MTKALTFNRVNTILYCKHWIETVYFYQHLWGLPVTYSTSWFVEFQLTETTFLSVADEARTRIKSSSGAGITLTLQVENIDAAWSYLKAKGVAVEPIKKHDWGAWVFYFYDPEGHRLEIWQSDLS